MALSYSTAALWWPPYAAALDESSTITPSKKFFIEFSASITPRASLPPPLAHCYSFALPKTYNNTTGSLSLFTPSFFQPDGATACVSALGPS